MGVESYMHRHAKSILADWLRTFAAGAESGGFIPGEFGDWASEFAYWRVNRGPPHYGVWEEWPICGDVGVGQVWDETRWPWEVQGVSYPEYNFDPSSRNYTTQDEFEETWSLEDKGRQTLLNQRTPTYEECLKMKMVPEIILDLAVQHKGTLRMGFEIVHKNAISADKMKKLKRLERECVQIYTVPAERILKQIGLPKEFFGERVI